MRKLLYVFVLLFFGANITSCTPGSIVEEVNEQACCDDDGDIPPPPPPPPTGGVN